MSGLKGYPDQKKSNADGGEFATLQPVRAGQHALDVVANLFAQLVATDVVEADSTTTAINATAHSALRGDIIRFTSGALDKVEVRVKSVTANAITPVETLPSAPALAVTFQILRQTTPVVDSSGNLNISVSAGGADYVDSVRHDHVTPVTTLAWTELIAATAGDIEVLYVWDSSGEVLELGVGAAAAESRIFLVPRGGINGPISLHVAGGSRLSVKAVSADTAGGDLVLTGLG
jgi:hypothetical protein